MINFRFKLHNSVFAFCLLVGVLTIQFGAQPVSVAGDDNADQRNGWASPMRTFDEVQNDSGGSNDRAAPRDGVLDAVKLFLSHKWTRVVIMSVACVTVLNSIAKAIGWLTWRWLAPNDQGNRRRDEPEKEDYK